MLVKESLKFQRLIGKNLPMGAHDRRIHKKAVANKRRGGGYRGELI